MLQLLATGSHFNNVFRKIIYLYQHGIFGYAEWKTVWKLFVIPNFCNQHIFAVVQLDVLLQVALFKKSAITDIKSSLLWYLLLCLLKSPQEDTVQHETCSTICGTPLQAILDQKNLTGLGGGVRESQNNALHYGSINSIKDLKYLKM